MSIALKTRGITILLLLFIASFIHAQSIEPPVAKKEEHLTIIHGDTLKDNYYWLRKKGDYEVINYLSAENGYAQRMTKSGDWIREKLLEEMKSRIQERETSAPNKIDDYYYYNRYEKDKNYNILCRKKGSMDAEEEVLLDVNKLADGLGYIAVRTQISPDHQWLAYQIDYTGGHKTSVYFKDLNTGEVINDELHRVGSMVWFNDSKTIAYTKKDTTNRDYVVLTHRRGDDVKNDKVLFEEKDKTRALGLAKTTSKKYILISSSVTLSSEIRFMEADNPGSRLKLFRERRNDQKYSINHFPGEEYFYVTKNFPNKNRDIVRTPEEQVSEENWEPFFPANDTIPLNGFSLSPDFMVVNQLIDGLPSIMVTNRKTQESYRLEFPDPSYTVSGRIELEYGPDILLYSYSSQKQPSVMYEYNLRTREKTIYKESEVPGYESDNYITARLFATADDGTEIPISVMYKKGLELNGQNPVWLKGYGSYGSTNFPSFSLDEISMLERGFVMATAHIRGGGEYGPEWYEAGKLYNKKNTFTDFIACSEYLINEGYTNNKKLVISGTSAGGLLMGAVLNMRPDLYQAAIVNVPFVDVVNTMLDETIPLTTFEYDEWGNPNEKGYFDYMMSYSPYDNIKAQDYPMMLVQGGYNDKNVAYWEPAKYVAKLRATKTDDNRLYLKTVMNAGHGLSSGRDGWLKQQAFEQSFMLNAVGVDAGYGTIRGTVTDPDGEPMPFVNVFLKGSTTGTTTNTNGEYALDLRSGNYQIVFSHVAYTNTVKDINVKGDVDLDVKLSSDAIMLKDIVVSDSYEDAGYEIIKKAMAKRKDYLKAVDGFSADVYMKSFDRLDEIPEKLPAFLPKEDLPDSTDLGLIYLSESISELYKKQPDEVKEVMISSKVGGWSQGYSWNQAGQIDFNYYQNLIDIGDLAARGIVSPIAANGPMFYRYKYLGEIEKQGSKVNKIEVIPRRRNDPVFAGNIYIAEDTWNVVGVDMILTNRQIEFYDTLHIEQDYVKIEEDLWMPLLLKTYSKIKIFGFAGSTNNIISYKNYEVNPDFPKNLFNNEIFKIEKEANKKDSSYWVEHRPVVLTDEEIKYYYKSDSTEKLHQSKEYLDSLDRVRNKVKWGELLTGVSIRNRYKNTYYNFSGLLEMLQFNTVEGLVANFKWSRYKGEWWTFDKKSYYLSGTLRYGFANQGFNVTGAFAKTLNNMTMERISFSGGQTVAQINNLDPISPIVNASYSLFGRDNYMKLYQKQFFEAGYQKEVTNGILLTGQLGYENRKPMVNHSDYAFVSEKEDRMYTSNNPLSPYSDEPLFSEHQALMFKMQARFRIKQKYATRPDRKVIYGSKYPTLTLNYKKGISALGSDVDFDFANIVIGDNLDLGLLGVSSYDITFGGFFNKSAVPFLDYKHFQGNETIFLNKQEYYGRDRSPLTAFHILDYYSKSTTSTYWEGHYEHHFNGFLLNKFPLVRKLKFQALGGVNLLKAGDREYTELYFGVENIFKVMRVDFAAGYDDIDKVKTGVRIWIGISNL
ncbi:DUF5686 family protein [Fulvivirga ligni]|uniref:DUF5686 family protein n=1 Tax=Fulvivirga ligni TaxID=2904246 RepID=UPI001F3C4841|nr:DUF5686 family protein [Fulvivirga ligni]UII23213.1 DUF5686 family protein [Fulvivirga ligni]